MRYSIGIQDENEIVKYTISKKNELSEIIIKKLPIAVVGYLLDKSDTSRMFDAKQADSLNDIFSNKLMMEMRKITYVSREVGENINNRIMIEIIPFYKELSENAVACLKNLLDGYIDYLANECQYMRTYAFMIRNK